MRDFGRSWTAAKFDAGVILHTKGLEIVLVRHNHLLLVSGDVKKCLTLLGVTEHSTALNGADVSKPYALAVARDRSLVVSPKPFSITEGWFSDGYAVSIVTDGYMEIVISGPSLGTVLARGVTVDWTQLSRSAAIRFGGFSAVGRFSDAKRKLHLFLESSNLAALTLWFRSCLHNETL